MTHILSNVALAPPLLLGQIDINQIVPSIGVDFGTSLLNLLKAIGIFIIGWIVAVIVKGLIKGLLNRTNIDNRLASWITGDRGGDSVPIENWIANLFYWLILLFAVVAFLNALQLDAVSAPLNDLLSQVTSFIPKIIGAAFLLGIAWVVATLVKTLITRGLGALNLERRLGSNFADNADLSFSDTIANALYWFIFLLFLPSILNTLQLRGTLEPVQGLLDRILAMLPNILGAVIIGAVFWFVAQIVSRIVSNLLSATGIDNIGRKFGFSGTGGRQSLSSLIGTLVFVLIIIPGAISALDQLKIKAISDPAINMLDQVSSLLPKLFAAGVVLSLFYVAGQFVSELVTNLLTSIGFNNFLQWLGISTPTSTTLRSDMMVGETEQPTVIQTDSVVTKTPSELVGIIVLVAIMLIATLTAVDILGIPALEDVVRVILAIAAQVLVGLVVFAIGLYLANLAFNLILSSGTYQARTLAQAARVAIITLVSAMALNRIGVAPNIVNLAFGLILGGIAVAIALAFGLGGREVAREQLRSWVSSFKQE
jgi:hypothetical protein